MKLFERKSSGELVTPFSPVLDDPKTQKELEDYVAERGKQAEKCYVVDMVIRLKNGAEIPVRAAMESGKLASIHYPDGKITSSWDKRFQVGMDYVTDRYKKDLGQDPLGEKPKTPPPAAKAPEGKPAEPPKAPEKKAEAESKEKKSWWKEIVIAGAICFGLLCLLGMGPTIAHIAISFGRHAAALSSQRSSAPQPAPTAKAKKGEIVIEKPLPFRPSEEKAQSQTEEDSAETSAEAPRETAVTDSIIRGHACSKPAATAHVGDLNAGFCGCKHQTIGTVHNPGRTACTWWVLNGGSEPKNFSIKTPLRVTENRLGMSTTIDHGDIECGGSQTIELQPGVPVACYLEYNDGSNGASQSITLSLSIRWDYQYGSLPPVGPIPIS